MTINKNQQGSGAFQSKMFFALWIATIFANVAMWIQNVGAGWVMVSLTPSPFMVALVQSAITLPVFLLGLPSGVISDLIDRQKLLLWTHAGMFLASGVLALASYVEILGPWTLLFLTFIVGCGAALAITARLVSISDVVPRSALVQALALNSIAYNSARAVGPALAGILLAWLGPTAVFVAAACMFGVVVVIQLRFFTPPAQDAASGESAINAMLSGLRYVRQTPLLHKYFMRVILFVAFASSLWALLPVIAHSLMKFNASGYALLLGCMGSGAVMLGVILEPLRRRYSLDMLTTASGLVFAAAIFLSALSSSTFIVCAALVAAGGAWVVITSITTAAVQTTLPASVRARVVSIYLLVFNGAMAFGGALWGAVASQLGLKATLTIAATLTVCGAIYARRYPILLGKDVDATH